MNIDKRAVALAQACNAFSFLGRTSADDLLALVAADLGHPAVLDEFHPRGAHLMRAVAPRTILHILAGNTPAAALQSLTRGLLLGAQNFAKLPSEGLSFVPEFKASLPPELAMRVQWATTLPDDWLNEAEAVVVFGSDDTIAAVRARVRADQIFVAHGHKVSFGVVFEDRAGESFDSAATDVFAFDQLGCLSPHVFYVGGDARSYAVRLAETMELLEPENVAPAPPLSAACSIRALREEFSFRAANGEPCAVWTSKEPLAFTVLYDESPGFPHTPLHRTIFVKPLPTDFAAELRDVREHLSCAGIFPATRTHAAHLAGCGVSRICQLGRMQLPPWTWNQDGVRPLASLVRWVDLEV